MEAKAKVGRLRPTFLMTVSNHQPLIFPMPELISATPIVALRLLVVIRLFCRQVMHIGRSFEFTRRIF